jgi:outer membrane protein assembly factor BamB
MAATFRSHLLPLTLLAVLGVVVAAPAPAISATGPRPGSYSWPVRGDVLRAFHPPASPYGAGHRGIDIGAPFGTTITAPEDGVVAFAGWVAGAQYVSIDHPDGVRTTYSWLSATLVARGDSVARGEPIAKTGHGHPEEELPHLHLGARIGDVYIDPMILLERALAEAIGPTALQWAALKGGLATRWLGVPASALVLSVAFALSTAPTPARGQEVNTWPSLQGGPAHPGVASSGAPDPPLRRAWELTASTASTGADSVAGGVSTAVVSDGMAFAVGRNVVLAIDVSTGSVEWTLKRLPGPIVPPAFDATSGRNGRLIFVEGEGGERTALRAVDIDTREDAWRSSLGDQSNSAPVILGHAVFVGSRDRSLYSFDVDSGELIWKKETGGVVDTSPAAAEGSVFVISENPDTGRASVLAVDSGTGRELWRFSPAQLGIGASSPSVGGGIVFAGFGDQMVRALDAGTGSLLWTTRVRSSFSALTTPAVAGGSVYVGDAGGGLYRMDSATGALLWDYQFPAFVVRGAPLVVRDTVYIAVDDGTVAAIRVTTGRLVWSMALSARGPGVLSPADDSLLVSSTDVDGGMFSLVSDPRGALVDVRSPSELRPIESTLNYLAAFSVMLVGLLALGRWGFRRWGPAEEG